MSGNKTADILSLQEIKRSRLKYTFLGMGLTSKL